MAAGSPPRPRGHGWMILRVVCLAVVLELVHAQEVELLDVTSYVVDSVESPAVTRKGWREAPVESATEYCGCKGFTSARVPGRTLYKPKLEDSRRSAVSNATNGKATGLQLSLRFDDLRDIGFDQGPRARATVTQNIDQIAGSRGPGSKAVLFKSPYSQLKLPKPISTASGEYTVSGWFRWPLGGPPDNEQGMHVLVAGFAGDFQVAVDKTGALGMCEVKFNLTNSTGLGTAFIEDIPPQNSTQVNTKLPVELESLIELQEDSMSADLVEQSLNNASKHAATTAAPHLSLNKPPECVACKPPTGSSSTKCLFKAPGETHFKPIASQSDVKWCRIRLRASKMASAAVLAYKHGPALKDCDQGCEETKERVSKLEEGRGTNELLAKSSEFRRSAKLEQRQKESDAHQERLAALKQEQALKVSELDVAKALVHAEKEKQGQIHAEIVVLTNEGVSTPTGLRLQNQSNSQDLANAESSLALAGGAEQNITRQVAEFLNRSHTADPILKPPAAPDVNSWKGLTVPELSPSGFNMSWLRKGWHHIAVVANGASSDFFIDSVKVGSVASVSKSDIYSFGNYQGGGYQWGALADLEVYDKAVPESTLKEAMGCRIPLVASSKLTASSLSSNESFSIWAKNENPWRVNTSEPANWIQVETPTPQLITALAVAGAGATDGTRVITNKTSGEFTRIPPGFVTEFSFSYSMDGLSWTDYEPSKTESRLIRSSVTIQGNTNPMDTTEIKLSGESVQGKHFRFWPKAWQKNGAMRVELFGCDAAPSPELSEVVVKSKVGGSSVTAECGHGYGVTGGGCSALNKPHVILWSAPEGRSGWKCEGLGNMKAMAICAPSGYTGNTVLHEQASMVNNIAQPAMPEGANENEFNDVVTIVQTPAAVAKCLTGKLISGGCGTLGSPEPAQFSVPYLSDGKYMGWSCGGNSAAKKTYALCGSSPAFSSLQVHKNLTKDDWSSLECPMSTTLIGGGCQIDNPGTSKRSFRYNGPDGKDKWSCGAAGTSKTIFVICANVTLANEDAESVKNEDVESVDDSTLLDDIQAKVVTLPKNSTTGEINENPISVECQCPVKCNCPTRNEIGFITDPDYSDDTSGDANASITFGSSHFSAHTHYAHNPRKIPRCICPARAPTRVMLEFHMQVPANISEFKQELVDSIDTVLQTPGQSCGCDETDSCKCRVEFESISLVNGTERKWQWRGEMDRWKVLAVDTVTAQLRINSVAEGVVESGEYTRAMSADALGNKLEAAISDRSGKLRQQWFFMHIAEASIVNRRLRKCDLMRTSWTYRDPSPNPKMNNGPSNWASAQGFGSCGGSKQSPIALGGGTQSSLEFWDVVNRSTLEIEMPGTNSSNASNTSNTTDSNTTAIEIPEAPAVPAVDPAVLYSNSPDDRLQFDYSNASAQVLNEGLFLSIKFNSGTNGSLSFKEEGRAWDKYAKDENGTLINGDFVLKRGVIHVPAEHTLKGVRHPMEIQYEHENELGEIKVVSTLLKFGFPSPFLSKVFADSVPLLCSAGLEASVDPSFLFPLSPDYYAYPGSETKPPCRAADWYVFKEPATVSLVQWIDVAKRLGTQPEYERECTRHGCTKKPKINGAQAPFSVSLKGNARPIQPKGADQIVRASVMAGTQPIERIR